MTSKWERAPRVFELLPNDGLDVVEFRTESLRRLRSYLSVDAAFYATVDPTTLLFTSALAEGPLATAAPMFLENEFGRDDVNKFAHLAHAEDPVATLDGTTSGDRTASARYREVIAPLGLGDELRVALVSGGRCWGVLCLHREQAAHGFTDDEIALLRTLGPSLAEGLRRGVALYSSTPEGSAGEGPGIIILDADLSVVSVTAQAEHWLANLADRADVVDGELPLSVYAVAAAAAGLEVQTSSLAPPTRLRRAHGGWVTVHASPLRGGSGGQIAVILDAAHASQLGSLVLAAHGLTPAQSRVAALVLQGRSTGYIVAELRISSNTVQEHLRAVFDKFGVGSRRELVGALSGRPN